MEGTTRDSKDGFTFSMRRGDGAVLLAFDVEEAMRLDLAGFAIEYTSPDGVTRPVYNRLSFEHAVTQATAPEQRVWTDTKEAPLQTFHWVHYPSAVPRGTFTYRATAMRFAAGSDDALEPGPTVELSLELADLPFAKFELGFTRGFLSSQAYADDFHNDPIVPKPQTIDFPTAGFEKQYAWLGFHARELLFEFLHEVTDDPGLTLDVFAYDLDEPDFVRALEELGPRMRMFLDDSVTHVIGPKHKHPLEVDAHAKLVQSAGAGNVKTGHFGRLQHNKVLIQRRNGTAIKVLSGSANFSVRGFYVQANNVFVFDDQESAGLYAQAFDQAWDHPLPQFAASAIASGWKEVAGGAGVPPYSVSFAPHTNAGVSLTRVADAIKNANSSVLFAVMQTRGGGDVLKEIHALTGRDIYAFGTAQTTDGALTVTSAAHPEGVLVPYAFLKSNVPPPFKAEIRGGAGQIIHHKFVVIDFNDKAPAVFAGSSNLAGGEAVNGDNLLCFTDQAIVGTYAVEAIQLLDHYRFRAAMQTATAVAPLQLKTRKQDWTSDFFEPGNARCQERLFYIK